MTLIKYTRHIRLAMLGMVEGNGHPYSWSAIINGRYDAQAMAQCGYPVIPQYLDRQPKENLGIPGVQVTHIWCDNPADAQRVAQAAYIPHVISDPLDVLGQVDAVVIPTDKGEEHVGRAKPFIEAGLPVFIDKPLCTELDDLRRFIAWQRAGRAILSTSCMRYAHEFADIAKHQTELGELRLLTMSMSKSWPRYGIHALEGLYPLLAPGGWLSVTNTGGERSDLVHVRHASGVDVILMVIDDLYGAFGHATAYGTKGVRAVRFTDTFSAFKAQLVAFVDYLRTGQTPFDFAQTVELMKIIIAGIWSRRDGGRTVQLSELKT